MSKQKAVIYCRVSSIKQTTKGDGLGSQETRCREYATYKDYEVVETFSDDVSGGLIDRPGIKRMLAFLRLNRRNPVVVIIDDISRLARGIEAHLQLRTAISEAGGLLESPSIEFGDDPDSRLVENLLACMSQHQRQKNAEQTKNRMRARTLNGYYVFHAPIGYHYETVRPHGKLLVRDEPIASILQEALEGYASGRFDTKYEVKRFLESFDVIPKDLPNGEIRHQRVADYLSRPLYAGYIEVPNWDVSLRKGHHEGLISMETYNKIQERLHQKRKAPARKDLNEDFPLRGFVLCGDCDEPMTACWSKGKKQKYPYYLCKTKGCESYRKSIPRADVEGQFEEILHHLTPSQSLYELMKAMMCDLWDQRVKGVEDARKAMRTEIKGIDQEVEKLSDRLVEAESSTVMSAFERKIRKLESRRVELAEKLSTDAKPLHTWEDLFEHAMEFLSNPWKLWRSDRYEDKRAVLKLTFADRLAWLRGEGFRTPNISMPFKALEDFCGGNLEMAHQRGFEPLASAFGGVSGTLINYII